ncbi:MAG: polysaccharide biosynthesis/export family protein [Terracidiphilus sp.]|jgi:polysaccharide export outer membrane protein
MARCSKHQISTIVLFSGLILLCATGRAQTTSTSGSSSQNQDTEKSAPTGTSGHSDITTEPSPFYRVSPGDTLDITVFGASDLSQKVRVTSKGEIYLPLVNYVHVGGQDLQEAQTSIESALKKGNFMVTPHVTIAVAEYASGVVLMGEVNRPGIYPVTAATSKLLDLLTEAGGTTQSAGQMVTITHQGNDQQQVVFLSHDPTKAMEANVPIAQGDTIMVSKAGTIFVIGEVVQPSAFIMENRSGYTALKALAMAHGATRLAKLSSARIIRQTPKGVQEIPVPLDKIAQDKAPDTELIADDILMVPTSKGKIAAAQAISMAQSITLLGVSHTW